MGNLTGLCPDVGGTSAATWPCPLAEMPGGLVGGNLGTLRIPREDWGTLGKIREDYGNHHPPFKNPIIYIGEFFSKCSNNPGW